MTQGAVSRSQRNAAHAPEGDERLARRPSVVTAAPPVGIARTTHCPPSRCGPSSAKGSPCLPCASASIAASLIGRSSRVDLLPPALQEPLGQLDQAPQRNADPGRTVASLVADLIGRLLDQEELDQRRRGPEVGNPFVLGRCGRRSIALEEAGRSHCDEVPEQFVTTARARQTCRRRLACDRCGGIIERAQQPGYVAQRTAFAPSFRKRLGRLALEVDKDRIVTCDKDLTEMEVPV